MAIYEITFSPTGGTAKAAELFTQSFAAEHSGIDLTDAGLRFDGFAFGPEDVCIVAVPSYGGRVPVPAAARLQQMHGNGAGAILMVVYGNRAYDDTFAELQDLLTNAGFRCAAGIAAVAEHSIMRQFAAGRPDAQDAKELAGFAQKIRAKLENPSAPEPPAFPGNRPYLEHHAAPMPPQTGDACTRCGLCAKKCPVGAIPPASPAATAPDLCISCMRCIALCPNHARSIDPQRVAALSQRLSKAFEGRKPNQLFL